jgi:hypothetical protein
MEVYSNWILLQCLKKIKTLQKLSEKAKLINITKVALVLEHSLSLSLS